MDRPAPPYDEMCTADGTSAALCRVRRLADPPADDALRQKRAEADSLFHRVASPLPSTASRTPTSG